MTEWHAVTWHLSNSSPSNKHHWGQVYEPCPAGFSLDSWPTSRVQSQGHLVTHWHGSVTVPLALFSANLSWPATEFLCGHSVEGTLWQTVASEVGIRTIAPLKLREGITLPCLNKDVHLSTSIGPWPSPQKGCGPWQLEHSTDNRPQSHLSVFLISDTLK